MFSKIPKTKPRKGMTIKRPTALITIIPNNNKKAKSALVPPPPKG